MQRSTPCARAGFRRIRRVHGAARRRPRPDHRVNFIDEKNCLLVVFDFLHDLLQAFLEVPAVAGAGEKRAHVERENRRLGEDFRHLAFDDLASEAFGDRGFADAGISDEQRIVLVAAAQHLDGSLDFRLTPNQRVDPPIAGLLVEIDAIGIEGAFLFLRIAAFLGVPCLPRLGVVLGATRGS